MILSILKIIGIILLILLVLFILILGILLLVPIRYRFFASYKSEPNADIFLKWNPVLFQAKVLYNNKSFDYVIRLLGGVVMTNQDIPLSWIGRKYFSFDKDQDGNSEMVQELQMKDEEDSTLANPVEKEPSFQQHITEKKKSITEKIRYKIHDFKCKLKNIIIKLKKLNEKKNELLKVYHHKRFEIAKQDVKLYVKRLWKIVKPKHMEGNIQFGFEDPSTTGQVLGILAMFLVWYESTLEIEPYFDRACFQGHLKGDGKIRLFPVVIWVMRIIMNKNLIKVIKKVQTIIES